MSNVRSIFISMLLVASTSHASGTALDAATKIAGKYTGQWSMSGVVDGKVVEKVSWTDVLIATNPRQENGKAFVDVSDVMTFSDGTTRTSTFHEGYVVNLDGSAGERYYDLQGTTTNFKKLSDNDWVYQATPADGELWFMGFDPKTVISASHVATKTTTYNGNIDTDHVTRLTTVQWKAADGSLKSLQFVSMKGNHTRVAQ